MAEVDDTIDWQEALRSLVNPHDALSQLVRGSSGRRGARGGAAGTRPVSGRMLSGGSAAPSSEPEDIPEEHAIPEPEQRQLPSINDDVLVQLIRRLNSVDPAMRQGRLQDLLASLFHRRSSQTPRGSEESASG